MKQPEQDSSPASARASRWKSGFRRFFELHPGELHCAAHSHHYWPDVTFEAQQRAWLDAARHVDAKWSDAVFGELMPRLRRQLAGHLGLRGELAAGGSFAFAVNTHEFVLRLLSCIETPDTQPVRILTTDGEFHSFARQSQRWEEAGVAVVERVAVEPFETFAQRFCERAHQLRGEVDLVYVSHVFFGSGFVFTGLDELADLLPPEPLLVVDGYHSFLALPLDWRALQHRAFYLSGGYKYAMAGEGCCFLHCPPGYGARPVDTGWYGVFGDLAKPRNLGDVPYATDGMRFFGATFDPSGLYRLAAVLDWLESLSTGATEIHRHVRELQQVVLAALRAGPLGALAGEQLRPGAGHEERGHFLTFELPSSESAAQLQLRLAEHRVTTDVRGQRIRFGFGIYHDRSDVEELLVRLRAAS